MYKAGPTPNQDGYVSGPLISSFGFYRLCKELWNLSKNLLSALVRVAMPAMQTRKAMTIQKLLEMENYQRQQLERNIRSSLHKSRLETLFTSNEFQLGDG
jgi:hypothetical protein